MTSPSYLITGQNYLPSLEGWRGVVALCVVSYHFSKLFFGTEWTSCGYLGVDFFFILSGFIITRHYEASIALRTINFKAFAIRRLSRLYPLYIVSIAFFVLVNVYVIEPLYPVKIVDFGMGPTFAFHAFLQLLMLGSLSDLAQPNGPVWSVSVEWMVNMAFFALIWRYRRIPNPALWIVMALAMLYLFHASPHVLQSQAGGIAICRGIAGFILGSLLFRHHRDLPDITPRVLHLVEAMLFAVVVALMYFHDDLLDYCVDYIFQLVLFPALILISLYRQGHICRIFSSQAITFLGRISYSIYLLHYPLAYGMAYTPWIRVMGYPWLGISYIVVLIALSTLSYKFIERPGRYIGRLLTAKSAKSMAAVQITL